MYPELIGNLLYKLVNIHLPTCSSNQQILLSLIFTALHSLELADIFSAVLLGAVLQCDWMISSLQASFLVTSTYIGMLAGGLISGILGDRLGRRDLLLLLSLGSFFVSVLIAISPTIGWIIFLRAVLGKLTLMYYG